MVLLPLMVLSPLQFGLMVLLPLPIGLMPFMVLFLSSFAQAAGRLVANTKASRQSAATAARGVAILSRKCVRD
ncbi:hypothetical protein V8C86DRAFT_2955914 [Haematococcus lacustris]